MKSPNFFEKDQVNSRILSNFQTILNQLNDDGYASCCPVDGIPYKYCGMKGIPVCRNTFPKGDRNCPCTSGYSLPYLKRRVKQIIEHHKKENP